MVGPGSLALFRVSAVEPYGRWVLFLSVVSFFFSSCGKSMSPNEGQVIRAQLGNFERALDSRQDSTVALFFVPQKGGERTAAQGLLRQLYSQPEIARVRLTNRRIEVVKKEATVLCTVEALDAAGQKVASIPDRRAMLRLVKQHGTWLVTSYELTAL